MCPLGTDQCKKRNIQVQIKSNQLVHDFGLTILFNLNILAPRGNSRLRCCSELLWVDFVFAAEALALQGVRLDRIDTMF